MGGAGPVPGPSADWSPFRYRTFHPLDQRCHHRRGFTATYDSQRANGKPGPFGVPGSRCSRGRHRRHPAASDTTLAPLWLHARPIPHAADVMGTACPGLRPFRQRVVHHFRVGDRERRNRADPSLLPLFRPGGGSHRCRVGGGPRTEPGGSRGRGSDCPDGRGALGRAGALDPRPRRSGDRIGAGRGRRPHRRGPAFRRPGDRGGGRRVQPTPPRRHLPGAPPRGRHQHRGCDPLSGRGVQAGHLPIDATGQRI